MQFGLYRDGSRAEKGLSFQSLTLLDRYFQISTWIRKNLKLRYREVGLLLLLCSSCTRNSTEMVVFFMGYGFSGKASLEMEQHYKNLNLRPLFLQCLLLCFVFPRS